MLDELSGRIGVEGGAETLARIEQLEAELRRERSGAARTSSGPASPARSTSPQAELDLLLCAAAPAIDPRFGRVYGFLNDDMGRRWLTPALAQRLLESHDLDLATLRRCLAPDRPLQRARARSGSPRPAPRTEAALTVPEEVIDLLLGIEDLDAVARRPSSTASTASVTVRARPASPSWSAATAAARRSAPRGAARCCGWRRRASPISIMARCARRCARSCAMRIFPARCLISRGSPPHRSRCAARSPGSSRRPACSMRHAWASGPRPDSSVAEHAAVPLSASAQAALFGAATGLARTDGVPLLDRLGLAAQFADAPEALAPALRARAARGMEGVAQPIESDFGFDDLVLAPAALRQLADFVSWRVHAPRILDDWGLGPVFSRRRGAVALFRGPPGTGKTMAASVIANAIGLPLYRVDLAGLVSKYIGETEKNLERLFAAAAASDVVLFFDEADALFGKRAEVSDAHDRYANIETSYLLQRIEAQDGAVILATNLQDNIDTAFLRRIDIVVDFPAPAAADRLRLWQRLSATRAPLGADLDLAFLAESFELTGGEIRNVLIAAAHAAARDGCAIGMGEIVRALAQEWQKLGRPLRRNIFGPHYQPPA